MKLLFDQGTPVPLRRSLHPHEVDTAAERDWSTIENGDLISLAEKEGYDAIITTDQNLKVSAESGGPTDRHPRIENHVVASNSQGSRPDRLHN